ncbi:uncharacterized protein M6B38_108120 [Iris pallida]|uniref:Uncharacterized protein n=1 Tax=Iris pallida TaxID=29817 RepID=A0AAX6EH66_IRIPA|nr:uncharacterized protein M6B38_108120 [Iris pallida]
MAKEIGFIPTLDFPSSSINSSNRCPNKSNLLLSVCTVPSSARTRSSAMGLRLPSIISGRKNWLLDPCSSLAFRHWIQWL